VLPDGFAQNTLENGKITPEITPEILPLAKLPNNLAKLPQNFCRLMPP
jgi:hypothetical protein